MSNWFVLKATAGMLTFAAAPIYCIYQLTLLKNDPNVQGGTFGSVESELSFRRPEPPPTHTADGREQITWSFTMLVDPKLAASKVGELLYGPK